MSEVFHLADRITILRDGRFVRTLLKAETNAQETAHLMVGRELTSREGRSRAAVGGGQPGDVVLDVRGLSLPWKRQPGRFRLRDISFQLHRGEILGIAGLMGAGRTELLECLFGASSQRPQGEMLLDGKPQDFRNPAQAMRAGMALVTEDRKRLGLFQQLSVRENITVSALSDLAMAGVVRSSLERERVARELKVLSVKTAGMDAGILTLSGGNQQKCVVARCLLTNPRVLLLDDPTRGVDVGAKAELYQLMEQLAAQGISMIVTSSELPELLTVSDRILVLCEGRLTGEFAVQDATEEKIMEAATSVSTLVTS
jgi:ABC-type sugar transport system ATPase subunit